MNAYERVKAYFQQHPNTWISAMELQQIGGWLSFRTRVSECRRWDGMRIDNRTVVEQGQTRSFYRYEGAR